MSCGSNTAVVSWSASRGALQYSVMAQTVYGNISCQSSNLNCTLYNLTCGSKYTVQVVAVGDSCSSVPSQAQLLNSGKRGNAHYHISIHCQRSVL